MTMQSQREYVLTCAKCGSTHFWEAEYRQYLAGMYASAPGGELHSTSSAARVRVCFCGEPALKSSILSLPMNERQGLHDSLQKARRYREEAEPEHLVATLRESFAWRAELEAVEETVKHLRKIVEDLAGSDSESRASGSGAE